MYTYIICIYIYMYTYIFVCACIHEGFLLSCSYIFCPQVMDNHYVPNLTIGPGVCKALREFFLFPPYSFQPLHISACVHRY